MPAIPSIATNPLYPQLRASLESRNLYTPNNPYEINQSNFADAINKIASVFNPTQSFALQNTVVGRLIGPKTPLSEIGLQQLAKQFTQRVTQNALTAGLPTINFNNLFDGNPNTKLLTTRVQYQITPTTSGDTVSNILARIAGTQRLQIPYHLTPPIPKNLYQAGILNDQNDNNTLIRYTGKGVLNFIYNALNRNLYKPSNSSFVSVSSSVKQPIIPAGSEWYTRLYFPYHNTNYIFPNSAAANAPLILQEIADLQSVTGNDNLAYGSLVKNESGINGDIQASQINVDRFGASKKINQQLAQNVSADGTEDIDISDNAYGFINDDVTNQIVWGRDDFNSLVSNFGTRTGMLAYTRALLTARSTNSSIDQTKTKWLDGNGSYIYNGSPLTRDNFKNTRSERQSSILRNGNDLTTGPYDNYNKAIRFDGNNLYNAPAESVINKSVIPKIHPIFIRNADNTQAIDNRNMMFSIENLAYNITQGGSIYPQSEIGPNQGRLMWFPPYGIQLNETATAKYESTLFIGRGEPIYTYNNSERLARLSFKVIIDCPPQVKGATQSEASKFFAFGGINNQSGLGNVDTNKKKQENVNLKKQLDELPLNITQKTPPVPAADFCRFYFINNIDSIDYCLGKQYETGANKPSSGLFDFGMNSNFLKSVQDFVNTELKVADIEDYKLISLQFVGSASQLGATQYNIDLSKRRIKNLFDYIDSVFTPIYGGSMASFGIQFKPDLPLGESQSNSPNSDSSDPTIYNQQPIKQERSAYVKYSRSASSKTVPNPAIGAQELATRQSIQAQMDANNKLIAQAEAFQQTDGGVFQLIKKDDTINKGFESVEKNVLSPVFHSQTPEDFHRRLTFLQQCTRQGNATIDTNAQTNGAPVATNSVFGRPPICILRVGDFYHTKVVIDSIDFSYDEAPWDMNPEGMGMQYMIADISMSMRVIGGQSLKTPIDILQNAESFNYYANSTYYPSGVYAEARKAESIQVTQNKSTGNQTTANMVTNQTQNNGAVTPTVGSN